MRKESSLFLGVERDVMVIRSKVYGNFCNLAIRENMAEFLLEEGDLGDGKGLENTTQDLLIPSLERTVNKRC